MPQASNQNRLNEIRTEYANSVVRHLNEEFYKRLSVGDKVADKVAKFGGSWTFISIFLVFLVVWMVINLIRGEKAPDPYPFILLNLVLSSIAALQAPVIMMAQNRSEERAHVEAELDYAINLKAEDEIADMQKDLHHIHQEIEQMRKENAHLKGLLEDVLGRLPPGSRSDS